MSFVIETIQYIHEAYKNAPIPPTSEQLGNINRGTSGMRLVGKGGMITGIVAGILFVPTTMKIPFVGKLIGSVILIGCAAGVAISYDIHKIGSNLEVFGKDPVKNTAKSVGDALQGRELEDKILQTASKGTLIFNSIYDLHRLQRS